MENKVKHLEFIQLTITRMNTNSFLIKGWLVTLVTGIFILSAKEANMKFLWFAPFATLLFWLLDAFFVTSERQFRNLYNSVRLKAENEIDYSMDLSDFNSGASSFFPSFLSVTLLLFYPAVLVASIVATTLIKN